MTIFVNDVRVAFTTYPNGELVVPTLEDLKLTLDKVRVRLQWTDEADLVKLALIRGLLGQEKRPCPPDLLIDYMPYSRMDRQQDGHCFSLKYVAALVRAMDWNYIRVVEPHSDATTVLLGATPIWATREMLPTVMETLGFVPEYDYLVLPDAGALKRYAALFPEVFDAVNYVVMRKKRDFETGKILGLEVDHQVLRGFHKKPASGEPQALIIDDLSSRGGTFVGAATVLRELDIPDVSLLVTHMESAGLEGALATELKRVFCADTMPWPIPPPANFTVLPRSIWL